LSTFSGAPSASEAERRRTTPNWLRLGNIPEERRRRPYWNGVLARAEVDSRYQPARKLWRRERQGHYVPGQVAVRVASDPGKPDVYVPLARLVGWDLLEPAPVQG
jgi:hypothetical protein